ncbi:MAG: hypothetical protein GY874_19760 [Desulfobacteraceae bacterium]|nr:hypothetical protein [Desulfobacteraceae bacterium]
MFIKDVTVIIHNCEHFFTTLMLVARIIDPATAFFDNGIYTIAMQN